MVSEDENTDERDEKQIRNKISTTNKQKQQQQQQQKHVLWFIYI